MEKASIFEEKNVCIVRASFWFFCSIMIRPRTLFRMWEWALEGRCLQRQGAAVKFRIRNAYDALSCICRLLSHAGRSGSPPETEDLTCP
jgi:hypothetical protein